MDNYIIVVGYGNPLPSPGEDFIVESTMTEEVLTIQVKRIERMRWHSKNNRLIVEVTGVIKGAANGRKTAGT